MQQSPSEYNVSTWLDYINQLHHKEMDFGLDRLLTVATPVGWQRFSCPVITVTGTNGKGSCVRFLENIFTAAGFKTGAYTSPHLMCFNERIRIGNQNVDDQTLISAFQAVEQQRDSCSLSFFEFTFLAALQIFQNAALDVLILEVGLGGRLDAVNIVDADVAVITTIDLDHMDILGPDRESIAAEKAGIFRAKRPVVCGDPDPPANCRGIAKKLQAPWYGLNESFHYQVLPSEPHWQWQGVQNGYDQLPPIQLKHQNAATSLMVVELLQDRLPVTEMALKTGLATTTLAGRFEKIIHDSVSCYLDVAHNPQGARWLAEQWRSVSVPVTGRRIAVFGMLSDKDIAGTGQSLLNYIDSWYVATLSVSRGANALQLQSVLLAQGAKNCHTFSTVEQALQAALADASLDSSVILVFGSFYTVAAARQFLLKECLI